jgi:predicted molibdopterin-dependent oxidoreductase YjgC
MILVPVLVAFFIKVAPTGWLTVGLEPIIITTSASFTSSTGLDTAGKKFLAGLGSAKGSNEEAYLFQKLIRTGFGSNNVDHCTRLCHASSVVALLECLGSGRFSYAITSN